MTDDVDGSAEASILVLLASLCWAWIVVASTTRSRNDPDSSNGSDVVAGLSAKEEKTYGRYFHVLLSSRFVRIGRAIVNPLFKGRRTGVDIIDTQV